MILLQTNFSPNSKSGKFEKISHLCNDLRVTTMGKSTGKIQKRSQNALVSSTLSASKSAYDIAQDVGAFDTPMSGARIALAASHKNAYSESLRSKHYRKRLTQSSKMQRDGRVTIPLALRRQMRISSGDRIEFQEVDGTLFLMPVTLDVRTLKGILRKSGT